MIKSIDLKKDNERNPISRIYNLYIDALQHDQKQADAASIATYNPSQDKVSSRFVNIKYITENSLIFFSNYKSRKARDILLCKKVALNFFWNKLNTQIRAEGIISLCNDSFSDEHFSKRTKEKNALAISSNQSAKIKDFAEVIKNYNKVLASSNDLNKRPAYWGGFEVRPSYIEIWSGDSNRLNRRDVYELNDSDIWNNYILEP
jgi:pyridoxamine 5'-phosphate oxidase